VPVSDVAELLRFDREHVWHPYAALPSDEPRYVVKSTRGCRIELADGRELVDGIASWWAAIFGYGHPALTAAAHAQLDQMAHVMFGGLTHAPAVRLAERLIGLAPAGLDKVFFCDSGSVSVEVAMKLALQYQVARGERGRTRFLTVRRGYHGDTWHAMSVCDPERGMHGLFAGALPEQVFVPEPSARFGQALTAAELEGLERSFEQHASELCAVILEPIVQNAGGMRFYSAQFLRELRRLCDASGLLLICDEIATGFGRTGKLFACEHAGISPDVLCLGKALAGGYLSFAATLTSARVSDAIARGTPGTFMHGPTFMANPLACSLALAVLDELERLDWRSRVAAIEAQLVAELEPCRALGAVADVRVLGAIGVLEMKRPIDRRQVVPMLVERGVWLRPFGELLYTMPPYVIDRAELARVTGAMRDVASELSR
jgi:adenosylmethionine---8-amino-7-oxononanoate aminotransferase